MVRGELGKDTPPLAWHVSVLPTQMITTTITSTSIQSGSCRSAVLLDSPTLSISPSERNSDVFGCTRASKGLACTKPRVSRAGPWKIWSWRRCPRLRYLYSPNRVQEGVLESSKPLVAAIAPLMHIFD